MNGVAPTREPESPESRSGLLHNPWFWAVAAGIVIIPLMRPFLRYEPDPPPVLLEMPEWSLTDQHGQPFGSAELEGDVYVASFLFTRCTSICPLISRALSQLDERYEEAGVDEIELVGISVDPEFDTPAVLSEYAAARGLDGSRIHLLTGDSERVREVVVQGFKTAMGEAPDEEGMDASEPFDIVHAGKLVLVDREGGIRGYYEFDSEGIDEVFHRSQHVADERRGRRVGR